MKPEAFACPHFDVKTNFVCGALPGCYCAWPDSQGRAWPDGQPRREFRDQFHPERIELARSIADGPGETPTAAEFDHAVEAAIGETL